MWLRCNYRYIIFWLIPLSQLAGPLQTTVSKNPKKPLQRPPAAVAATAATAWRVKIGDGILGTLNIGMPAASATSNIAPCSYLEYNIYIYIYLLSYSTEYIIYVMFHGGHLQLLPPGLEGNLRCIQQRLSKLRSGFDGRTESLWSTALLSEGSAAVTQV